VQYALIAALVIVIAVFAVRIVAGVRHKVESNASFLSSALIAQDLPAATSVQVSVDLVPGAPHAVWLDVQLAGGREIAFELALAIDLGGRMLVDGTYPVTFDDEHDARGLPNPPGISALNTSVTSTPGSTRITTTLRAFRFDAPSSAQVAQIRAKLLPGPGMTLDRARLVVTTPDAPPGAGLPAGMRAVG
jgi:hypothetical protein